jgi:hypothetical protein
MGRIPFVDVINEQNADFIASVDKFGPEPGEIYEVLVPYNSKAEGHEMELMDSTEVRVGFYDLDSS